VVSELLEGQTLRERMAGGALPVRKAAEIGAQIARGLAAAHEKGIVHRDLKPENVFVSNEGHVKILDFGLAKLTQSEAGDGSQSPTRTSETDPGVVMGTVGYMSPEQVRGGALDHRTDIFSFGAILYELLSGRRAFKKETSAETLAAILNEEPADLTETNPSLPPALERIVRHCLEKSPQERFASARDLAFDLESMSERSGPTLAAKAMRDAVDHRRRVWVGAGWLASVAAVGVGAFWLGERARDHPQPTYQQLSFGHGNLTGARFSPDGASVLYSAAWNGASSRIFALRLDLQIEQPLGFEGRLVGAAAGEVAFLRDDGTLLIGPLSGGGSREVAKGVGGADWSKDGTRFAITRRAGAKQILEYPIGTVLHETVGDLLLICISPDGSRVAIVEGPSVGVAGGWIGIVDTTGIKRLTNNPLLIPTSLVWSADGKEIWFTTLEALRPVHSINAVSASGRERHLLTTAQDPRLHAISQDGRVLLSLGQSRRKVSGLAPGETVERDLTLRGWSESWDISVDGRRYVIGDNVGPRESAFLGSMDGSPPVRLGDGGVPNALAPDGRSVLMWKATEQGIGTALVVLSTGAGEPRDVPKGSIESYEDARWLSDGRRLLMSASEAGRPRRLFVQELPDGLPRAITPEGIRTTYAFATPDGAWVPAGSDFEAAPYALYPVAGGDPQPIPGLEKGDQPLHFTADGRRLFVRHGYAADNITARIALLDLATGRKQPWKVLRPTEPAGVSDVSLVYLTPDGRGYLYMYDRRLYDLFLVEGLR